MQAVEEGFTEARLEVLTVLHCLHALMSKKEVCINSSSVRFMEE